MFTNRTALFGLTTLALAGLAVAPAAHAQSLLVSNVGSTGAYANTISRFGLDGSFTGTFLTLGAGQGLADSGTLPAGLAQDSAGNVYIALSSDGVILQYNPITKASSVYATIPSIMPGFAFGTSSPVLAFDGTNLFVSTAPSGSSSFNGAVYKITPNAGGTTGTATKLFTDTNATAQNIGGVAVDSAGNVYLGDGNNTARVLEIDPNSGAILATASRASGGPSGTTGVTVGPDGTVYATEFKGNLTKFSNPFSNGMNGTNSTAIANNTAIEGANTAEGVARPRGIIFDSTTGDLLVVDGSNGSIDRFTTSGAAAGKGGFSTLSSGTAGFNSPDALLMYNTIAAAPEPSQAAVLGLGMFGLCALGLRARRRTAKTTAC